MFIDRRFSLSASEDYDVQGKRNNAFRGELQGKRQNVDDIHRRKRQNRSGGEGRKKSKRQIEADFRAFLFCRSRDKRKIGAENDYRNKPFR